MATMRDNSRAHWSGTGAIEHINAGSFQRIADACELMASNYRTLISDRDMYERRYKEWHAKYEREERRNRSLRGAITRLKRQLAEARAK